MEKDEREEETVDGEEREEEDVDGEEREEEDVERGEGVEREGASETIEWHDTTQLLSR